MSKRPMAERIEDVDGLDHVVDTYRTVDHAAERKWRLRASGIFGAIFGAMVVIGALTERACP